MQLQRKFKKIYFFFGRIITPLMANLIDPFIFCVCDFSSTIIFSVVWLEYGSTGTQGEKLLNVMGVVCCDLQF